MSARGVGERGTTALTPLHGVLGGDRGGRPCEWMESVVWTLAHRRILPWMMALAGCVAACRKRGAGRRPMTSLPPSTNIPSIHPRGSDALPAYFPTLRRRPARHRLSAVGKTAVTRGCGPLFVPPCSMRFAFTCFWRRSKRQPVYVPSRGRRQAGRSRTTLQSRRRPFCYSCTEQMIERIASEYTKVPTGNVPQRRSTYFAATPY